MNKLEETPTERIYRLALTDNAVYAYVSAMRQCGERWGSNFDAEVMSRLVECLVGEKRKLHDECCRLMSIVPPAAVGHHYHYFGMDFSSDYVAWWPSFKRWLTAFPKFW